MPRAWISTGRVDRTADALSAARAALLCIVRDDSATVVSEARIPRYRCRERVSGKPPAPGRRGPKSPPEYRGPHLSPFSLSVHLPRGLTHLDTSIRSRRESPSGAPFDARLALHPDDRLSQTHLPRFVYDCDMQSWCQTGTR